jgi:hypothetical protein
MPMGGGIAARRADEFRLSAEHKSRTWTAWHVPFAVVKSNFPRTLRNANIALAKNCRDSRGAGGISPRPPFEITALFRPVVI